MSLALKLRVACLFVRNLSVSSVCFLVLAYLQHSSHKPIILRQQNNLHNWHNEHECTSMFSSNTKRRLTCRAITCCSAFMHFCTMKTLTHIPTIIHTIKTAVTLLTCTHGTIPNTKRLLSCSRSCLYIQSAHRALYMEQNNCCIHETDS